MNAATKKIVEKVTETYVLNPVFDLQREIRRQLILAGIIQPRRVQS